MFGLVWEHLCAPPLRTGRQGRLNKAGFGYDEHRDCKWSRLVLIFVAALSGCLVLSVWVTNAKAEKGSPEKARKVFDLAKSAYATKDYDAAIRLASVAIDLCPDCGYSFYRFRGGLYCKVKADYLKAVEDFTKAIEQNDGPAIYYLRGDALLALGYTELAIQDYKRCLERTPNDGKVWYYLARAYALNGRKDLALQAIEQGLATGTHHAGKLIRLREAIERGTPIPDHAPCSN